MITAAVILLILLFLGIIIVFNRLIRGRNLMREAWSGIDVQLKRRHDLVSNLVEVVKGYRRHERGLLEDVTKLRSRCVSAEDVKEKGEAENALSRGLKTLFAVVEGYPDLKAGRNFLDLQQNLSEIEDQIQFARRYYNGTVRNYNIRVESFPSMLVAKLFRFPGADFFEIEYATERKVPEVKMKKEMKS